MSSENTVSGPRTTQGASRSWQVCGCLYSFSCPRWAAAISKGRRGMWANKGMLFHIGQLSSAATSLIRDSSTWPSLGGSQCCHPTKEGSAAERKQSCGVTLGQNQNWDSMFPLPPTGLPTCRQWAAGSLPSLESLLPVMSLWPRQLRK